MTANAMKLKTTSYTVLCVKISTMLIDSTARDVIVRIKPNLNAIG